MTDTEQGDDFTSMDDNRPAEKWKARARDIACSEVMMRSAIDGNAVAWLEDEIAAALAETAAEERERCVHRAKAWLKAQANAEHKLKRNNEAWVEAHNAIEEAIRGKPQP